MRPRTSKTPQYSAARRRPINKRTLLIAALLLGQLACLLTAVFFFGHWLEQELGRIALQRTQRLDQQLADNLARLIDQVGVASLAADTPGRAQAEALIAQVQPPGEGSLCLVDSRTGAAIVCSGPASEMGSTLAMIEQAPAEAAGWIGLRDGSSLFVGRTFDRLGATLVVHQPAAGPTAVAVAFVQRMRLIGTVVIVALVALSALVSFFILRAYDNRVADVNEQLERAVQRRSQDVIRSRDAVIFGLAMLAERRDGETGEHLDRIGAYTAAIARQFIKTHPQLDERWVDTLRVTSALHDIGKVGIPDAVLRKPQSLTGPERQIIEQHPYIGGDTLLELKRRWGEDLFLNTAAQICLGHHERWDGTGYPFKLKGEEIPLPARIVALADVYDALTSRRAYKERLSHEKARQMIVDASGSQFDPQVVEAFVACERELADIAFHARREVLEEQPPFPAPTDPEPA